MNGYNLSEDQRRLLLDLIRCDNKKTARKGFINTLVGDDKVMIPHCFGEKAVVLSDLEALADAGLLVREQGPPDRRYRITNAAYTVGSGETTGAAVSNQDQYLPQLRDQIACSFSLEELQLLVFDLGLDWEDLQGTGKTARVQDLIVQLGRNGRLEELVDLLREKRPHINWPNVLPAEQQTEDAQGMTNTANEMESTAATRQAEPRARGEHMEQYFDDGAPGKEKLVKRFVYPGSIGHFKAFMRRLEKVDLAGGWEASNGVVLAFHDTYPPANEKCGRWTVYPYLWKNNISAWATIEACEERLDATAVYCFDGYRAVSLLGDLHDRPRIGSIFLEFVKFLEREASAATKPAAHAGIPSPTLPNPPNTTRPVRGPAVTGGEASATDTQAVFVPKRPADLRRWKTTWKRIRPHVERGETVNELISLRQEKSSPETLEKIIRAGEAGLLS